MTHSFIALFYTLLLYPMQSSGQSVIDDINAVYPNESVSELFQEEILKISLSKKILLISNDQKNIAAGDYISLLINKELAVRAIVAKLKNNTAGIKITKIYSGNHWNLIRTGLKVDILRGDDSYYLNAMKQKGKVKLEDDDDEILSEEDLFKSAANDLDKDASLNEKTKRAIKTDNLIGLSYGLISGLDNNGGDQQYDQFGAHWAYQVFDNLWAEFFYGQSLMNGFPNNDIDTTLTNYIIRVKYAFKAPLGSQVLPYLGFKISNADSPDAGKASGTTTDATVLAQEESLVAELNQNTVVLGVSLYKRLVPGWFIKADLGTDILNIGFCIEF